MTPRETRLAVVLVVVVETMTVGALGVLAGLLRLRSADWVPLAAPLPAWSVAVAAALLCIVAAQAPPRVGALLLAVPLVGGVVACAWLCRHGAPRVNEWTATALVFSSVLLALALVSGWRLWHGGVAWRPQVWLTATAWLVAAGVLYA